MLYKVLTGGPLFLALVCFHFLGHQAFGQEDANLKKHYENILKDFKNPKKRASYGDCKADNSEDEDQMHHHWGTISSLEFLTEKMDKSKMLHGEKRVELVKLRKYLARVGYLRRPGSIVFINKQTATLRLSGCKDDSAWRLEGVREEDMKFQEKHHTGDHLKAMSPNPTTYLHKYTCFSLKSKCTHTFYVITKPLPEMPVGLQVSAGSKSEEYEFTCTMPYCHLKSCKVYGKNKPLARRPYPPYSIKWDVPGKTKKLLKLGNDEVVQQNSKVSYGDAEIEIKWENILRKGKDYDSRYKDSYESISSDIVDGFGDEIKIDGTQSLHSRIIVKKADKNKQGGTYECIISDGNGVASSPNKMFHEYMGKANINVMPFWQKWLPSVIVIICAVAVTGVIFGCPMKMEHDDGTMYTKDEIVVPAETEKHS